MNTAGFRVVLVLIIHICFVAVRASDDVEMSSPHANPHDFEKMKVTRKKGSGKGQTSMSASVSEKDVHVSQSHIFRRVDGAVSGLETGQNMAYGRRLVSGTSGDYDLDGDLDLFLVSADTNGGGPVLLQNQLAQSGEATFINVATSAGVNYALQLADGTILHGSDAKFVDINRDGYPDLVITMKNSPNLIYLNLVREKKHFSSSTPLFSILSSVSMDLYPLFTLFSFSVIRMLSHASSSTLTPSS